MSNSIVDPAGVSVVGNFFNGALEPLDDNGDGSWTYPGRFTKGDTLLYKFVNGLEQEMIVEGSECIDETGNRILVVSDEDKVMDKVCFNACASCNELISSTTDFNTIAINAFPNPMDEGCLVSWEGNNHAGLAEIILTDITGRIVRQYRETNRNSFYLRREELNQGLYFLRIRNEVRGLGTHKIVIR